MDKIFVRNEDDLETAITKILETEELFEVEFKGWPRFEITIRGEQFDGGVPTRVMPALLDLQRKIDHAYATIKYGEVRRLTNEEKKNTEIVLHFQSGRSTTFFSELEGLLNNMASQAITKMDGTQAVMTVLGVAAIVGGVYLFKTHLNNRLREKEMDLQVELSREETRRQEKLIQLSEKAIHLKEQITEFQNFQDNLMKKMAPEDQLIIGDTPVIDGETAQKAIRRPRAEAVESRIDGQFIILNVESGAVRGGFRIKVRNTQTNDEMTVKVPDGTLNEDQITTLQNGEWGKVPLSMNLNVKLVNERITEATLVKAGLEGPSDT